MLNENLKQLRKSKGLTQEEFALQLGVVRQTISKWEKVFDRTELEKYLSADGTLRVRYQVADDMDVTDKNCTLPCLQITGKVVTPDA